MMKLKLWQVDAFASKPFEGNPAAVVLLDRWPEPGLLQKIASENNLAETAFLVRTGRAAYDLRWCTPTVEVDLCGHATLASAWVLFSEFEQDAGQLNFSTRSGTLTVMRGDNGRNVMSLPTDFIKPFAPSPDYAKKIGDALNAVAPGEIYKGANIVAVFERAADVRGLDGPGRVASVISHDMGLIVTAPGDGGFDFVSRYFAPHHGIPEDPVTGSAHCSLTPYWAKRLGKKTMKARQVSPRGGDLHCTDDGDRTIISGSCMLYMVGEITV